MKTKTTSFQREERHIRSVFRYNIIWRTVAYVSGMSLIGSCNCIDIAISQQVPEHRTGVASFLKPDLFAIQVIQISCFDSIPWLMSFYSFLANLNSLLITVVNVIYEYSISRTTSMGFRVLNTHQLSHPASITRENPRNKSAVNKLTPYQHCQTNHNEPNP